MAQKFLIVDGFLDNPEALLQEARVIRYTKRTPTYLISEKSKFAPGITRKIAQLHRGKMNYGPRSGTYRITTRDEKKCFYAHADLGPTSLIYLNRPKDCHGGTAFFIHKKTGLDGLYDTAAVLKVLRKLKISIEDLIKIIDKDGNDPSKWIQTDFIKMKHNRLIIFDARYFHSAIFDFKKVKANQRLSFTVHSI